MAKPYSPNIVERAQTILNVWEMINDKLAFGNLNPASLSIDIDSASQIEANIALLKTQLIDLRNRRDDLYTSIWDKLKRIKYGIKAVYGDDSSQYEMVGGTRLSERKSPVRSTPA